ncbi:Rz-like lysis system protein LysB [Marinobacterium sp. OS208]|nr:Rz-like lysis system protein LysB [Marinobacterium sedimentorum]MCP8687759.1 Rz-like lysis system protein LysB [Marinobacterium sedimentorum]
MTRLAIAAVVVLITLVLGAGNYLQYQQLNAQRERAVLAEQEAQRNLAVIDALERQAAAQHESLQALNRQQAALRTALGQRELILKHLERDNENYRQWAAARLPDAARRLRQRPAITGAADYQQFLSADDPVPATGDGPNDQRQPDG